MVVDTMDHMNAPQGCIPVKLRENLLEPAAKQALIEWMQGNKPWPVILSQYLGQRWSAPLKQEAVSLVGKTWRPGSTVGVKFLDGSASQRRKVQHWAEHWLEFANLNFRFGAPNGEIAITFRPGGSYSLIGTDAMAVTYGPTMQFGWVTDDSGDESDRAVILHEFGHALGLGHEQAHPNSDIHWDRAKADSYYRLTQGWDERTVEVNVFETYSLTAVESTPYDRTSIMQYPVPAELTADGRGIGWNTELAYYDKAHVASIYPGRYTPLPATTEETNEAAFPPQDALVALDTQGTIARAAATPGQPARWRMQLQQPARITLQFKVADSFGRGPIVLGKSSDGPPFAVTLDNGYATLDFQPGDYELALYHPMASEAVRAGARATVTARA